jgi:hypothetical protein
MPNEVAESVSKEKSILRWGGLAGILAGGFLLVHEHDKKNERR